MNCIDVEDVMIPPFEARVCVAALLYRIVSLAHAYCIGATLFDARRLFFCHA